MLVIPAIDLMGGEVVRLEKGDFATKTVYARRPADKAAEFARAGATLLHVVDLDGAKAGWPVNLDAVAAICRVPGLEVELGGGLRTLVDVERVLAIGVRHVVLGTAAVERLGRVEEAGVSLVEYTDVGRDGMFTGVDAEGAARIQAEAGVEVVASGGVASLADVKACKLAGLHGVIVGKALYEGRIELREAVKAARG